MPYSGGQMDAYVRALAVFEDWLMRQQSGKAESQEELLAAHENLREPLADMLAIDEEGSGLAATTAAPRRDLPAAFGAYRILELIGQGGMGSVFLAQHRELGRRVALKIIRPERLFSSVAKERFWREARAVAKIEHPNICPVYEVGEVDGVPFMAMRYLEGKSLARIIADAARAGASMPSSLAEAEPSPTDSAPSSRKDVQAVVAMIEAVARALHAAHEGGIIHRDIKPGNILITTQGEPVVLDFGLARAEEGSEEDEQALTMTGDLPGTPLYMSPEQIAPDGRRLDRMTDVYSLGVTLYECLTLRRPFGGTSVHELQDAILDSQPVRPTRINRHIPKDLETVLEKAMEKERERRYRTALEFAEDLRRVRSFEPIKARRASMALRMRRWVQRYPLAASFLAVVTAGLIVISWRYLITQQAYAEYDQLSWLVKLEQAKEAERGLPPAFPDATSEYEAWLRDEGEPVRTRLPRLRESLQTIAARPRIAPADRFASEQDQFKHDVLSRLVKEATGFVDGDWGELARVRTHLAWMRIVNAKSIANHRKEWNSARQAIGKIPKYQGLELTEQMGLVPIGVNTESGLWEFAHIRSGTIPDRNPVDNQLEITGESGLVFVLIPAGKFWMGAQKKDPNMPNYDERAREVEGPNREITLSAFFLSKYEMTKGQWKRLDGGREPSGLKPGAVYGGKKITLAHPVESVNWNDCTRLLRMYGLDLPTEAQWEYACRGGTETPWYTGKIRDSLLGHVNLADQAAKRLNKGWGEIDEWKELDDGYPAHAPVDLMLPNPFGLHHMHGNVWEWCRDWKVSYREKPRKGDGLRDGKDRRHRVFRGASFDSADRHARCAYRRSDSPTSAGVALGLRPFRPFYK